MIARSLLRRMCIPFHHYCIRLRLAFLVVGTRLCDEFYQLLSFGKDTAYSTVTSAILTLYSKRDSNSQETVFETVVSAIAPFELI